MFQAEQFVIRELLRADLPALQELFERNPDYFAITNDRLPYANEAELEFDERPPDHLRYGHRWFAGIFDGKGSIQGVIHVVSDLMAPAVWHLAFLFVAADLRGTGATQTIYNELESWMRRAGAAWIRLGVVVGNARAQRFWERQGYLHTALRQGVDTGGKINDVQMLVKPLADGSVEQFVALIPRDDPASSRS